MLVNVKRFNMEIRRKIEFRRNVTRLYGEGRNAYTQFQK
jgi:hypothetical protein